MKLFSKTEPTPEQIEELERAFTPEPDPNDPVLVSLARERRRREAGNARRQADLDRRSFLRCAICGSDDTAKVPATFVRLGLAEWLNTKEASGQIAELHLCGVHRRAYRALDRDKWPNKLWHGLMREALRSSPQADAVAELGVGPVGPDRPVEIGGIVRLLPDLGEQFYPSHLSRFSWLAAAYRARLAGEPDPGDGTEWSHLAKAE